MARMFTSGFKPKSTSQKAKTIIRNEMLSYFPAREYGVKSNLQAMKKDADAGNGGRYGYSSDYEKGSYLVQGGCCAISYYDQRKMLAKIYGKQNVDNWPDDKVFNTYKHLIGREYAAMLRERTKGNVT